MSKLAELCDEILAFKWEDKEPISTRQCGSIGKIVRAAKLMEGALDKCNRAHSETQAWTISAYALAEVEKVLSTDATTDIDWDGA